MYILHKQGFLSGWECINQVQFALPSLLFLVLLNVTLFLKLSKIEYAAQSFYRLHLQEEKPLKYVFPSPTSYYFNNSLVAENLIPVLGTLVC